MPEIPNQLIHPELQPHDDGSNANGVGVSSQPLAVPYQPELSPYAQPLQQQWQQSLPLPQQYQQPPQYQPPMPPPQVAPKRPKSRKRLWLIIGIVVLVFIVIISIALQAGKGNQPTTTNQATQPASTSQPLQPTAKPTQPVGNTIGKAVQVGNTWVVTINSVKTSPGSEFTQPKSGNTFVVVDVTVKNISSSNQPVSSLLMFNLKDATGQQYTEAITDFTKASPDGTVTPNSLLRGQLVYEVPSTDHTFTFSFQSDFSGSDIAEWNVSV